MSAHEENFRTYLRDEVNTAGRLYQQAFDRMMHLTDGDGEARLDLLDATEDFCEMFRLYAGALRRLASFAPKQTSQRHTFHA